MLPEDQSNDDAAAIGNVATVPEKTFMAEVTEEYVAEDDSQVTIKVGQVVNIYGDGEDQNGWFYGYYNNPDGTVSQGYLPSTYVTPLKGPEDSVARHDPLHQYDQPSAFGSGDSQPYKIEDESMEQPMISTDDQAPALEVDPNTILNTFTKYIEWLAAVILFLSGCLCIGHDSGASKALGAFQLIFAITMIAYLYLKREAFYDSPAILRAGIWFVISIFAWAAPPSGLLGGFAATAAMISNVLSHLGDSGLTEAPYFWVTIMEACRSYELINYGIMIVWALMNLCLWFIGKHYGAGINDDYIGGTVTEMEGISGFSFLISFNIMCLVFMNCKWILENLQIQLPMPFGWLRANSSGIYYALCATISFATIGHIIAGFGAYNSKGKSHWVHYYGNSPLWTGLLILAVLIPCWAVMLDPNLFYRQPGQTIFNRLTTIGCPFIIIILFFHGKGGWGTNYWKWMFAPFLFFIIDIVMRRNSSSDQAQ